MARYLVLGDPVVALGPAALIPDGALIVEGAEITAVGSREVLAARGPFDRVLGSAGHFVMPGFVNCHYHSELAIGPGLYQHVFEKANVYIQGAVGPVDEEDLYYGILWGLVTAIKGGQTGTVDMYYGRTGMEHFGCEPALRAYRDAGLRTAFGLVSRDQNIYAHQADETFLARLPAALADEVRRSPMGYAWPVDDVMATFETLSERWHGRDDRIRIVTAPDWTPACSDELYQRCARVADAHCTSLVTHALETRAEMMFSLERYGKPAVHRLADLGVLGPRTVLEHFVWVTDEEMGVFADSGAVASCDPGSNLRLASGVCRVRDLMAAGGRVGFGTDGISFSDHEDFFQPNCGWPATCSGCRARSARAGSTARRCCGPRPATGPGPSARRTSWAAWPRGPGPTCWSCARTGSCSRRAATTASHSSTWSSTGPRRGTSTRCSATARC